MNLLSLLIGILAALLLLALGLFSLAKWLEKHEPYASFMRLRPRRKLRFFRLLVTDPRVPRRVKVLPFLLAGYLAIPIDLIPDFIPVLGYVDDVAIILLTLALIIRLTPPVVIDDLLRQLSGPNSN
ncbi:MAG: DUF1232 domain-containing protein [Chloroflexi bacterium]|nr:DUF1232 domain-containing protein [Chloroflexota bacterium]